MNLNEMKQCVEILHNEWNLGRIESKAEGKICVWIELMWILGESENVLLYKENNRVIGFAGYSKKTSNKHLVRKKFYHFIEKILSNSKKIKDKEGFKKYYDNYDYLPNRLKEHFDGQVTMLIVDKNYRGKSIGKKLLLEIFELAKKDNMKNIQITTDESCNYKIYEKLECTKIFETIVKNQEPEILGNIKEQKAFIYERKFI